MRSMWLNRDSGEVRDSGRAAAEAFSRGLVEMPTAPGTWLMSVNARPVDRRDKRP